LHVRVSKRSHAVGCHRVSVEGEIDLATVSQLEAPVAAAIDRGSLPIVVDLIRCSFIDSSVIRTLARAATRLEPNGEVRHRLAIAAGGQPLDVLRLTSLDSRIPIYPSASEAEATLANGIGPDDSS
jgi:anti-sigma B factor antagonist